MGDRKSDDGAARQRGRRGDQVSSSGATWTTNDHIESGECGEEATRSLQDSLREHNMFTFNFNHVPADQDSDHTLHGGSMDQDQDQTTRNDVEPAVRGPARRPPSPTMHPMHWTEISHTEISDTVPAEEAPDEKISSGSLSSEPNASVKYV